MQKAQGVWQTSGPIAARGVSACGVKRGAVCFPKKDDRQSEDYPPLTQYKLAHLGTPEAVSKSYRTYRPKAGTTINSSEVLRHIKRVTSEGSCKFPKPMVVPASSDRTKLYYPSCTILHRCDEHAGCCMAPETCAPKSTATVELYFFVSKFGSNLKEAIALSFVNHTECHCVQLGHRVQETDGRRSVSQYDWESTGSSEGTGGNIPTCKCPELFKPIFDHGSKCYCDCVSGARDCIRFKEGLEHFSMQTRAKILSNQFKAPSCEYGAYLRQEGRCPTKSERIDTHFSRHR
uniref:Platelet-derived growth factor (PDGF) family profile domain-containing protein n=1 Tax=Anopheles atroparvus TaxID=41427 RepID=A0A182JHZ3_ANOAO